MLLVSTGFEIVKSFSQRVQRAHAYISVRATTTYKKAKKKRKLDEIASIVTDEYLFKCNRRQKYKSMQNKLVSLSMHSKSDINEMKVKNRSQM